MAYETDFASRLGRGIRLTAEYTAYAVILIAIGIFWIIT